jgi:two-component system NtrC family sensor kinase
MPQRVGWLRGASLPLLLLVIYAVCFGLYSLNSQLEAGVRDSEQLTIRKVSQEMTQLQSTLDYFLREGNLTAVRELVASLGYNPQLQVGLLVDEQQVVLASTRLALLGRPAREVWPELELPENTERWQRALKHQQGVVEVSADRQRVVGYYPVVLSFGPPPRRVGFLFFQHDLSAMKSASRSETERSVLLSTLMLLGIAGGVGLAVQLLVRRRIQRLVVAAQGLVEGEPPARPRQGGSDVLVHLSQAFDLMAEQLGRNREQLRENEERFQKLIERTPDAILIHREGRVVFHNPAAAALLGYERAVELQGQRLVELVGPEDEALLTDPAGDGVVCEVQWRHRAGRSVLGEVVTFALVFEGQASRVSIMRDITERKHLREKLHTADRMASLGTLAAGVAHELNNPLSFMLSNVRFVRDELRALSEGWDAQTRGRLREVEEALEETLAGGDRVSDIVRDLRTFSRGDEGKRGLVNVHSVLDLCGNIARSQLRHRAQLVKAYGELPPIQANESRLAQLFLNLIVNAAQAIPEGADPKKHEVRLSTSREGEGWVVVEVRDTGVGIPPENLHRLFDPFFTTKPVGVGTGLGLSICHGIVTGLGGRITVESEPGRGTAFRVALPVAGAEATRASGASSEVSTPMN